MNSLLHLTFHTGILTCAGFLLVNCESPPVIDQNRRTPAVAKPTPNPVANTEIAVYEQTETIASLKNRLLQSYTLYWPHISSEYQHEQLPNVLHDPLPELRQFGIERVAILLRDGDATDEELQLVVDMLRDPSSRVRLAAAQLLPEINVPGLANFVANSLEFETDSNVIIQELAYFRTQPSPLAIAPTIALLTSDSGTSAAETLVVLLDSNEVSTNTAQKIVRNIKKLRRIQDRPALITLEAMLGDVQDKQNLAIMLGSTNIDFRIATAKGFASAGFAEPLIRNADAALMYDYALIALQKHTDIDAFKQLMSLYKENNAAWDIAAFEIAMQLSTSEFLRADDMLKKLTRDDIRLQILSALWESADSRSRAAQKAIARRAVPLMIGSGEAVAAVQLLDHFGESLEDDLLSLRFNAAISAAAWDTAANARATPAPWIVVWQEVLDDDPTTAAVISQQIVIRFAEQLTPEQREQLGIDQEIVLEESTDP